MAKKLASRQKKAEAKTPNPPDVPLKEEIMADFSNAADKIIFTKALSDITCHDPGMRADAAKVIAGVRHKSSVKAIVAQMANEPSAQVRRECIKALMKLEMKEGVPVVERALSDQEASVRLAAVWAIYHLAGAKSAPTLAHMFSDEDEEVRRRAAACVGWLGRKKFAVKLLPFLADSSVSVRLAAVESIGNLRSRQVVSTLIKRLNDPEVSVRKAIVRALTTITGKRMDGQFPTDERSLQRLIVRWREWWQEEHHG